MILLLAALLASPQTIAESSAWKRSGPYAESQEFCRVLAERYPTRARCTVFGTTPEGRPMVALVLGEALTPEDVHSRGRFVLLAQGGIHAGEIDGKDAGLALARDILDGRVLRGLLERMTFVFVPVFNVDGHENAAADNRPNQIGPETPGFRVTSQRLNLNRDYVKADAPEMRAMLALLRSWDPLMYVDLHTTDGMDFQNDVAVMIEPRFGWPSSMRAAGAAAGASVMAKLRASRHLPLDFYPSTNDDTNPLSGWSNGVSPPRFSTGYWPLWQSYAVLVETHALKSNAERIRASRDTLIALLEVVRDDGQSLAAAARVAPGRDVELAYEASGPTTMLDFAGVAYEQKPSVITGKTWVAFDPRKKTVWKTPFVAGVTSKLTVRAPGGGYLVAPGWASVVEPVLSAHGLTSYRVHASPEVPCESFKFSKMEVSAKTSEGRTRVTLAGAWAESRAAIPEGALFIPINQRASALVMHLFEPQAPDSLVSWGFMNTIFEQREYVELSVLEPFAQKLLATNKTAKAEWEALIASGATESARMDFFYRRHPAFDRQLEAYPVRRLETAPGKSSSP